MEGPLVALDNTFRRHSYVSLASFPFANPWHGESEFTKFENLPQFRMQILPWDSQIAESSKASNQFSCDRKVSASRTKHLSCLTISENDCYCSRAWLLVSVMDLILDQATQVFCPKLRIYIVFVAWDSPLFFSRSCEISSHLIEPHSLAAFRVSNRDRADLMLREKHETRLKALSSSPASPCKWIKTRSQLQTALPAPCPHNWWFSSSPQLIVLDHIDFGVSLRRS